MPSEALFMVCPVAALSLPLFYLFERQLLLPSGIPVQFFGSEKAAGGDAAVGQSLIYFFDYL